MDHLSLKEGIANIVGMRILNHEATAELKIILGIFPRRTSWARTSKILGWGEAPGIRDWARTLVGAPTHEKLLRRLIMGRTFEVMVVLRAD